MNAIIAFAAAALVVAAAPATARTASDEVRVAVSYADLDLSRADGRAALERRVDAAVARVCPSRPLPQDLAAQAQYRQCHASALAGARRQLASVYDGRQFADAAVQVSPEAGR
jgi:UrcA family protein